jgi:hypothetical protein
MVIEVESILASNSLSVVSAILTRLVEISHVVERLRLRTSEVQIGCWLPLPSEEGTRQANLIAPANLSQLWAAMSKRL